MENKNIEQVKTFTNAQVIRIVAAVIVGTFFLTGIFMRFIQVEIENDTMQARIEYVNDRLTRHINKK